MRRALVIHIDERIMHLLPEYLRLGWPLLQTDITRAANGGHEFFAAIDEALHDPRTPALVFEVHFYCLSHGYIGMFGADAARREAYKARLAERIPHPATAVAAPDAGSGSLPEPWPMWRYYALGLAARRGARVAVDRPVEPHRGGACGDGARGPWTRSRGRSCGWSRRTGRRSPR
jgi:hypothetical protein